VLVEAVKRNTFKGSSTAVLASLEEPNIMKTTNLGDSGYVIYRATVEGEDGKITLLKRFRSKEQQYRFNFPYQCGTGCELPYKAFDNEHEVASGKDFVVMGSDGLFDNLYDKDLEPCLLQQIKINKQTQIFQMEDPTEAATCIAK